MGRERGCHPPQKHICDLSHRRIASHSPIRKLLRPQPWRSATRPSAPSTRRPSRRPGASSARSSPRRAAPPSCSVSRKPPLPFSLSATALPTPARASGSSCGVFGGLIWGFVLVAQVALGGDVRRVDEDRGSLRYDEEPGGTGARRQRGSGHRGADARARQGGVPHPLVRRSVPGAPTKIAPIWSDASIRP